MAIQLPITVCLRGCLFSHHYFCQVTLAVWICVLLLCSVLLIYMLSSAILFWHSSKELYRLLQRYFLTHVCGCFFHNSNGISLHVHQYMNAVHIHNGILFSHKKTEIRQFLGSWMKLQNIKWSNQDSENQCMFYITWSSVCVCLCRCGTHGITQGESYFK